VVKLTVFDLDNTLYDWVSYFVPAFGAMVQVLVNEHGADEAELLASLQRVHQAQGTTEYAFALSELDLLHGIEESATANGERSHPAIAAFRREADRRLRAYDDVPRSLTSYGGRAASSSPTAVPWRPTPIAVLSSSGSRSTSTSW
jgi:FMN phosphatase YigB (HAD superfamily)